MVGIVIVNYKSDELTVRFVSEELCKTVCPHRTVIVDVGGTLGEVPDAVVLKEENRGFAHACNVGAMYMKGEVSSILFMLLHHRFTAQTRRFPTAPMTRLITL